MLKASAGTRAYAAPEQTEAGATVDCRADIYALGKIMSEMPGCDRAMRHVARRCFATNPAARPRRADEIPMLISREHRRHWLLVRLVFVTAVVVVAVITVPAYFHFSRKGAQTSRHVVGQAGMIDTENGQSVEVEINAQQQAVTTGNDAAQPVKVTSTESNTISLVGLPCVDDFLGSGFTAADSVPVPISVYREVNDEISRRLCVYVLELMTRVRNATTVADMDSILAECRRDGGIRKRFKAELGRWAADRGGGEYSAYADYKLDAVMGEMRRVHSPLVEYIIAKVYETGGVVPFEEKVRREVASIAFDHFTAYVSCGTIARNARDWQREAIDEAVQYVLSVTGDIGFYYYVQSVADSTEQYAAPGRLETYKHYYGIITQSVAGLSSLYHGIQRQ